jgi:hypothetical protein
MANLMGRAYFSQELTEIETEADVQRRDYLSDLAEKIRLFVSGTRHSISQKCFLNFVTFSVLAMQMQRTALFR